MTEEKVLRRYTGSVKFAELEKFRAGFPFLGDWSLNFPWLRDKKKSRKNISDFVSALDIFMSLEGVGDKLDTRGSGVWLDGIVYGLKGVHDGLHIGTAPIEAIEKVGHTLDRPVPFADYYIVLTASNSEYVLLGWDVYGKTRKMLTTAHYKNWYLDPF